MRQQTATLCNTLQHNTLQHAATHSATHCNSFAMAVPSLGVHSAVRYTMEYVGYETTHCNTLQHSAMHCNTLQHSATHCNTLQHTATYCNTLQHSATHYNTLQHTTTHCNTHCDTLAVAVPSLGAHSAG